ncbi:ATP-binding protein [Desulfobacterales bacterium HSG16]|nr:ATP-binding protein [Desulfobacterales bacterium HSG16]
MADTWVTFIVPNDPAVIELVRRARERLGIEQSKAGFPEMRPVEAVSFLYRELARHREPAYAWEPTPCNEDIQVIRMPRRVLDEGEGTCIDLALLLCSAIEHIRLLPVVLGVNVNGWHVIPGVRRNNNDVSSDPIIRDADAVKKSCQKGRTVLFDPDSLIRNEEPKNADMNARNLLDQATESFVVDVQAARNAGIWPLPVREPSHIRPTPYSSLNGYSYTENQEHLLETLAEDFYNRKVMILLGDALDSQVAVTRQEFTTELSVAAGLKEVDYHLAASKFELQFGRKALIDNVLRILSSKKMSVTEPYQAIAKLPIHTVVSYFPDLILENCLDNIHAPFKPLIEDDDLSTLEPEQNNRLLYLLGGSAITGKGLVLTKKDQNQLQHRIRYISRRIRERLVNGTLLLLNCNMNDLSFMKIYIEATHSLRQYSNPVFISGPAMHKSQFNNWTVLKQSPVKLLEELVLRIPEKAEKPLRKEVASIQLIKHLIPYKYLDYYDFEDKDIFFGRDDDIENIFREIMAASNRMTILCGRSGVGKTSLVKAGLMPKTEKNTNMAALYTRLGSDPEESIAIALQTLLNIKKSEHSSEYDVKEMLKHDLKKHHREILIFIDQFEEVIIKSGMQVLNSFFFSLRNWISTPDIGVRIILIIREDYLGKLANHQKQFPGLHETVWRLDDLTYESASEAIIKPAEKCGLKVEDEFVESLLNDLSPDRILPVNLQIVCDRIYKNTSGHGLSLDAYVQAGGARRILKEHLENIMSHLPSDIEKTARKVLQTLVTSEKTKSLLSIEEIGNFIQIPLDQLQEVVFDLTHHHRLIREVGLCDDSLQYELIHESLAVSISEWLESDEIKIKEVQEILKQEVSNTIKNAEYMISKDRLRLIDEYREHLYLDRESIITIAVAYARKGDIQKFWLRKMNELDPADFYKVVFGQSMFQNYEKTEDHLINIHPSIIEALPDLILNKNQGKILTQIILTGKISAVKSGLDIAVKDRSEMTLAGVMNGIDQIADDNERISMIIDSFRIGGQIDKIVFEANAMFVYPSLKILMDNRDVEGLIGIIGRLDNVPDIRSIAIMKAFEKSLSESNIQISELCLKDNGASVAISEIVKTGCKELASFSLSLAFKDSTGDIVYNILRNLSELSVQRLEELLLFIFNDYKMAVPVLKSVFEKYDLTEAIARPIFENDRQIVHSCLMLSLTEKEGRVLGYVFSRLNELSDTRAEWIIEFCLDAGTENRLIYEGFIKKKKTAETIRKIVSERDGKLFDLCLKLCCTEETGELLTDIFTYTIHISDRRFILIFEKCLSYQYQKISDFKSITRKKEILKSILHSVLMRSESCLSVCIQMAFWDDSGEILAAIFHKIEDVSKKKSNRIMELCLNFGNEFPQTIHLAMKKQALEKKLLIKYFENFRNELRSKQDVAAKSVNDAADEIRIKIDSHKKFIRSVFSRKLAGSEVYELHMRYFQKSISYHGRTIGLNREIDRIAAAQKMVSEKYMKLLDEENTDLSLENELYLIVLAGRKRLVPLALKLALEDVSGNQLYSIFYGIKYVPDDRAELILNQWPHTDKRKRKIIYSAMSRCYSRSTVEKIVLWGNDELIISFMTIALEDKNGQLANEIVQSLDKVSLERAKCILSIRLHSGKPLLPEFLEIVRNDDLGSNFIKLIIESKLHHWPEILIHLLERTGSSTVRMLSNEDDITIVRMIIDILRGETPDNLKRNCLEFIKNIRSPSSGSYLFSKLQSYMVYDNDMRKSVIHVFDKRAVSWIKQYPGIIDIVIEWLCLFDKREKIVIRGVLVRCMPYIRQRLEKILDHNSEDIRDFIEHISIEYDAGQSNEHSGVMQ